MVIIQDKSRCSGCAACAQVCPSKCVTMKPDVEGFLYPITDKDACIDCGLCTKVCHEQHPYEGRRPLNVYAAYCTDQAVRLASSSGGLYSLLAKKMLENGGVVFGARFNSSWQVEMGYTENHTGMEALRGSKYVQAKVGEAYRDVRRFLEYGRQVLFCGTPCQVSGLRHFLNKDYGNLLLVDFACHGVPSPRVWEVYLKEIARSGGGDYSALSKKDAYLRGFLSNMTLRPSCYNCKAKSGRSHSDITLADFWGIERLLPEMDDDCGVSLLMVNTDKGRRAIDWSQIRCVETDYDNAVACNPSVTTIASLHPRRKQFFIRLKKEKHVAKLIEQELRPGIKWRLLFFWKALRKGKIDLSLLGGYERGVETDFRFCGHEYQINSVCFRNKRNGWRDYFVEIRKYEDNLETKEIKESE